MLEVFAVIMLCRVNSKNAVARGKRPGGFIALTIILWVIFELTGVVIGFFLGADKYVAMLVGLMCAGLGGLISFLCAKFGPRGNYVDPNSVTVAGPVYGPNGAPVYTNPQNVQPGQPAYMYTPNQYQPAGAQPVFAQPVTPAAPAQPASPAAGVRYCRHCGSPNETSNRFCESCGQNIE